MKKILSIILTIVMLFCIIPFNSTVKNVLGASEAYALETVNGSYDFLWKYIDKNGQTLDGKKIIFYSLDYKDSTALWIIINDSVNNKLSCTFSFLGKYITMYIGKNDSTYLVSTSDTFLGVEYIGRLSLDPKTYSENKTYYFQLSVYDDLYEHYQDVFDSYLKLAISGWNIIMKNTGITLANFGFINAGYKACAIPATPSTVYTVTFNANGGSVSPSSAGAAPGNSVLLPVPTRKGYTCLGWATSKSATKADYRCDSSYSPTGNITLYAVWKADSGTNPGTDPDPGQNTEIGESLASFWNSIVNFFKTIIDFVVNLLKTVINV